MLDTLEFCYLFLILLFSKVL